MTTNEPPQKFEDDFSLHTYHEKAAGRLVIDPEKAVLEFGPEIASRLKLSDDQTKVLWPQPLDDPRDPQNWSISERHLQLAIATLAATIPDFNMGIGIAGVFDIGRNFGVPATLVTSFTTSWGVFMLGWGGIVATPFMRRYGRLPVLFWSQFLSLMFLIGCAFAPNLRTFAAMRFLTAFFSTVPQVTGLYVINDIFPFHLQAKKLNIWVTGIVLSPFLPPFALGYMVSRTGFRSAYGVGVVYNAVILLLTATFARETMFPRHNEEARARLPKNTAFNRLKTLVGVTGVQFAKYHDTWSQAIFSILNISWRPHLLGAMLYEGVLFGFSLGMNTTTSHFLGEKRPLGYGYNTDTIATIYLTPIVSVLLGQIIGHYLNDAIAFRLIHRNHGVFLAESRLWMCLISLPIYVIGLVLSGLAFQGKLSPALVVIGWGVREIAVMTNTVAIYAYSNDCFPHHQGEISALLHLFRTLGGFGVNFFQVDWAKKSGALQVFGVEAGIVSGVFLLIIPAIYFFGPRLRGKFSVS